MSSKDNSIKTVSSRRLALALALAVISTALVPVTVQAAEVNESPWIELLEFSSVNGNGVNTFTMQGKSGSFTIPLLKNTMVARVDALIWHQSGEPITDAKVGSMSLSVTRVNTYVSRVYGMIPNGYYKNLTISLNKASTSSVTWEVLSCRYTPLSILNSTATGEIWVDGDINNKVQCPGDYVSEGGGADITLPVQVPVLVSDWQKYDTVTIHGSMAGIGLNSVRASIGDLGVPYEITYTASVPSGTAENYRESVSITHYDTSDTYYGTITGAYDTNAIYLGKTLFTVTIDLTGVNRQVTNPLTVWFTGVTYDSYSHMFNVQGLTGGILVADTTEVTWWTRFTSFFTELFGGDTPEADDFKDDMQQQGQLVEDAADQIDTVTRPALDDVDVDIGQFVDPEGTQLASDLFGQLFSNNLVMTMVMISLMVALAAFIIFGKR